MIAAEASSVTSDLSNSMVKAWDQLQSHETVQFHALEALMIRDDLPPEVTQLLDALDRASTLVTDASGVFAERAQDLVNYLASKTGAHHGNAGH